MRSIFYRAGIAVLTISISVGCGKTDTPTETDASDNTPNESQAADVAQQQQPSGPIDTGLEPSPDYPVPHLAPMELLSYIHQVAALPPHGETDDEYIADQVARARSQLVASDRIILSNASDKDLMTAAVQAKLECLKVLAILDTKGLGVHFEGFVEALLEGDSEEYKKLARNSRFWLEVDKMEYGQVEDAQPLVSELKRLIEDPNADEAEFLAAQNGGYVLNNRGYADEATEVLNLTGKRFSDHEELGDEAKELLEKTAFREKVMAAMGGKKSDIRTLFLAIRNLLKQEDKLTVETLDNTLNAAQVLEFNGSIEEAKIVFKAIKTAFSKADEKLAKQARISVNFAEKRLSVIGSEIEIEGTEIDGSPFNWEKYKGKVVLVDFWASNSSPWLDSLPSLKSAYDQFHKDGFEVVGVNVDSNRDNAFDYLRTERLPWPMLVDEISPGIDANPNAIRYGVRAVPFVMLVGRDGKVADIHVRGPQLAKRVEELLEMPSSKNASKDKNANRK